MWTCSRVGLVAADYPGLKPRMDVKPGDFVRRGQPLFADKRLPDVPFTAPGAGTVVAVHRGERRSLLSVAIELSEAERRGDGSHEQAEFASYTGKPPGDLTAAEIRDLLVESGLWTTLRTRPFAKVPDPAQPPQAIFVTAMDSHPLAPQPEVVLETREVDFAAGIRALSRLTDGPTYVCVREGSPLPVPEGPSIRREEFAGPHPAGTAGVHINVLHPVSRRRTVWYAGYQDVAAIGHLVHTGRLDMVRVVSLAGPGVIQPRLVTTRVGASLDELTEGQLHAGVMRVLSGSVLGGRAALGPAAGYLGRYHKQVTVLPEGGEPEFLPWLRPGGGKFSVTRAFSSAFAGARRHAFNTGAHGPPRPMVPIGAYERVMPMDIEPTFLLRALITGDLERAEELGCLDLDEEDLALCTFVCPGKYEYGPLLREALERLHKEG
jgi:Na+-transporting NADH:ubiquinone oxidoreductase subunit A